MREVMECTTFILTALRCKERDLQLRCWSGRPADGLIMNEPELAYDWPFALAARLCALPTIWFCFITFYSSNPSPYELYAR